MKAAHLFLVFLTLTAALNLSLGQTTPRTLDRGRLPAALRNVPLERLSSGALLRLDLDGDLVETPEARARRTNAAALTPGQSEAVTVALDQRVGPNIRLGDDPAALPSSTRAQAEPHIARALSDPDFLLATFQEGRLATGGAVDCGFSVTHDGGLTWTRALIPNLTHASGGPYDRTTDPVAAIALNGTAYLNTLGLSNTAQIGTLLVSRSTDGGNTFAPPVIAYNDPSGTVFVDKNWLTVNTFAATPTNGRLVATFTLFSNTGGLSHPIMRVFSDNGGSTWSSPAFVHAASTQAQGSQPTFLRDGRLAIPYWNFNGTDNFADDFLELVVSDDGGNTFGAPKFITPVQIYDQPSIRDGAFLPAAATDRNTGALFVTYQAVHNGAPRIMFTKSANAGDTWTTPIPISNNPAGSGVFNPAIASSPDGQTLTVAFYDLRNHPGSTTLVDMYLAQSFDGGATWQPNIRLTSKSSDATLAPNTGTASAPAYMLGDYLGIAGTPNPNVPAVPVWVDTRTGNPDPWVTRVGISATPNFTSWQAARLSLGQINNPALGGEAGDADGDGEDNLSEFRRGTDPNNAASVVHTSRPVNISTRARIENGENVLIGGFIITGPDPKRVILRAVGPSLTAFGVFGALADPTLELVPPSGAHVFNDDWRATSATMIEATGLAPQDDRESAIVRTLAPGAYTAIMRSKTSAPGIGIVEVYDLAPAAKARFANLSSRARVGVGDRVMIGGFIVGAGGGSNGAGSVRVVARGIGPSLGQSGVADPLQNPELLVYDVNANLVGANDNWRETQEAELQALNLAPADNREAALAITLRRGNYTAIVRGKGGTTGVAVVEVYLIP
ncbi:MAG: sialidase family protein [Chthoniobacterales bacterium]